jgi:hypothetical protein
MRKNLLNENPELAMTWDYAKNAPLRPEHVSPMSRKSVWWVCPSGHILPATVGKLRFTGAPWASAVRMTQVKCMGTI